MSERRTMTGGRVKKKRTKDRGRAQGGGNVGELYGRRENRDKRTEEGGKAGEKEEMVGSGERTRHRK